MTAAWRTSTSGSVLASDRSRSEEHTSELQSRGHLVCRLLLEKKLAAGTGEARTGAPANPGVPGAARCGAAPAGLVHRLRLPVGGIGAARACFFFFFLMKRAPPDSPPLPHRAPSRA